MITDMAFDVEIYVGKQWNNQDEVKCEIEIERYGQPIPVRLDRVSHIVESAGRMVNAWVIDNWIGMNCSEYGDTTNRLYVNNDVVEELKNNLEQVLANPEELGEDLLEIPYLFEDDYPYGYSGDKYLQELKDAYVIILDIWRDIRDRGVDFYYYTF